MYEDIVKRIIRLLDEDTMSASYPKFSGRGYRAHKIDARNFHDIKERADGKKIAFVDGGNAEILGSGNFSLSLIRSSCIICKDNKRVMVKKLEEVAFTQAINIENEIFYKTSFSDSKNSFTLGDIILSSYDRTLMVGAGRVKISRVPGAIRRFLELTIAKTVSDNRLADMIVLDGDLQSTMTNENTYLNQLYESCTRNNVILTALSKTSSIFTDNGNLLSVVLNSIGPNTMWFYYPVAEVNDKNHRAEIMFVKFHEKSKHVFRFEIFNAQASKSEETVCSLAGNCKDPIFMGYPYGLVEADKIARVSNQEKDSLKTMFLVKLKNKNIEKYLSTVSAHEILDKISF